MPCLPSTSTRRVRLPSVARASARAAATGPQPVPPLPLTTWNLLTYSSLTSQAPAYARDRTCQALQSGP
ncbi:hypothetical protein SCALM49S_05674 [Streptomyces californicus]